MLILLTYNAVANTLWMLIYIAPFIGNTASLMILYRRYHQKNMSMADLLDYYPQQYQVEKEANERNLPIDINTTTVDQAISLFEASLTSDTIKILYSLNIYFEILEDVFPKVVGGIIMQYYPPDELPQMDNVPNNLIEEVLPNMKNTPKTISLIGNNMRLSKDIFTLFNKPLPYRQDDTLHERERKCCVIL